MFKAEDIKDINFDMLNFDRKLITEFRKSELFSVGEEVFGVSGTEFVVAEAYDWKGLVFFDMEGKEAAVNCGVLLLGGFEEELFALSSICSLSLFRVKSAGQPAYVATWSNEQLMHFGVAGLGLQAANEWFPAHKGQRASL